MPDNPKKIKTKAVSGPGGVSCPCCTGYGKRSKRRHRQILRRIDKQDVKAIVNEEVPVR